MRSLCRGGSGRFCELADIARVVLTTAVPEGVHGQKSNTSDRFI